MQTIATQTPALVSDPLKVAISTPKDIDITVIVKKNADRVSKNGVIIKATDCNRSRLFSATCAEMKSLLGMESQSRLSAELADKVNEAIDNFLMNVIKEITPTNIVSHTRSYKHKQGEMSVVEQVRLTGYNILELKTQFAGINELIKQQEKRLGTLKLNYADPELITNCEKSLLRMNLTKEHITAQLNKLKEVK